MTCGAVCALLVFGGRALASNPLSCELISVKTKLGDGIIGMTCTGRAGQRRSDICPFKLLLSAQSSLTRFCARGAQVCAAIAKQKRIQVAEALLEVPGGEIVETGAPLCGAAPGALSVWVHATLGW